MVIKLIKVQLSNNMRINNYIVGGRAGVFQNVVFS
jgi:ribosomal protein S12